MNNWEEKLSFLKISYRIEIFMTTFQMRKQNLNVQVISSSSDLVTVRRSNPGVFKCTAYTLNHQAPLPAGRLAHPAMFRNSNCIILSLVTMSHWLRQSNMLMVVFILFITCFYITYKYPDFLLGICVTQNCRKKTYLFQNV